MITETCARLAAWVPHPAYLRELEVDKRAGTRAPQVPDGLLFHSAIVTGAGLHVVDLWESRKKLDAFMGRMLPITKEEGFPEPKAPPEVTELHYHFERR